MLRPASRSLFRRAMATVAQPITYTVEGAVSISYKTLFSAPEVLAPSIGLLCSQTRVFMANNACGCQRKLLDHSQTPWES